MGYLRFCVKIRKGSKIGHIGVATRRGVFSQCSFTIPDRKSKSGFPRLACPITTAELFFYWQYVYNGKYLKITVSYKYTLGKKEW